MAFGDAVPNPLGFVALRQKHDMGEGDEPHRQRRPCPWTVALPRRGLSPGGGLLPSRALSPPWRMEYIRDRDLRQEIRPSRRQAGGQKASGVGFPGTRIGSAPDVSGPKREIPGVRGQRPRRPVVALSPSTQKADEPLWLIRLSRTSVVSARPKRRAEEILRFEPIAWKGDPRHRPRVTCQGCVARRPCCW